MIPDDARRMLEVYRLAYVATVTPDGRPNLSPKGTVIAYDDCLAFADIRSPQTVSNLQQNPAIEINIVDPLVRRGYRFSGEAQILRDGTIYDDIVRRYRDMGVKSDIGAIVLIRVQNASEVTSPLYDLGHTQEQIREKQKRLFDSL